MRAPAASSQTPEAHCEAESQASPRPRPTGTELSDAHRPQVPAALVEQASELGQLRVSPSQVVTQRRAEPRSTHRSEAQSVSAVHSLAVPPVPGRPGVHTPWQPSTCAQKKSDSGVSSPPKGCGIARHEVLGERASQGRAHTRAPPTSVQRTVVSEPSPMPSGSGPLAHSVSRAQAAPSATQPSSTLPSQSSSMELQASSLGSRQPPERRMARSMSAISMSTRFHA